MAAYEGFVEIVDCLLDDGAIATAEDEESYTPLHLASMEGHVNCAQSLIEHVRRSGGNLADFVNNAEVMHSKSR